MDDMLSPSFSIPSIGHAPTPIHHSLDADQQIEALPHQVYHPPAPPEPTNTVSGAQQQQADANNATVSNDGSGGSGLFGHEPSLPLAHKQIQSYQSLTSYQQQQQGNTGGSTPQSLMQPQTPQSMMSHMMPMTERSAAGLGGGTDLSLSNIHQTMGPSTPMTPATPGSADPGIVPQLQNIVSTVNLCCKLDLKKIALHARNAEYNPKRFAAVIMRIREPRTTALIFSSGKMVCTGAKSEDDSRLAARKYARIIQKLGFQVRIAVD